MPYDRGWIYRGNVDDIIVDIIWGMPNRRTEVDLDWVTRGPCLNLQGDRVRVLPPEELIWAKIYVLQRDRSDWPDILNLIFATGPRLDSERLLDRLGEDALLLAAILSVFRWLNPAAANRLPQWLWNVSHYPNRTILAARKSTQARQASGYKTMVRTRDVVTMTAATPRGVILDRSGTCPKEAEARRPMLVGAMNHPAHDVYAEIQWISELGFEFIDLTLEPPAAASWKV